MYPAHRPFRLGGCFLEGIFSITGVCSAMLISVLQFGLDDRIGRPKYETLRFPLIQEFEQNLWRKGTSVLKLAVLLANEQFAVALDNG